MDKKDKDLVNELITLEELNSFYEKWKEFKGLVKVIDIDMKKAANNNRSAALRARHGLRMSKAFIHEILMEMLERDKILKQLKKKSLERKIKKTKEVPVPNPNLFKGNNDSSTD